MSRTLAFVKMHGAGNDFIMLDGRHLEAPPSGPAIASLCHRHKGVGADGLILLAPADGYHFRMIYWNADGGEAEMCGNGARCAVEYAGRLGLHDGFCRFVSAAGDHDAVRHAPGDVEVALTGWQDLDLGVTVEESPFTEHHLCNTGVPHLVIPVEDIAAVAVTEDGARLRHAPRFAPAGVNVNWIAPAGAPDHFALRTYERGVEGETLACGTGASAAAVILCHLDRSGSPVTIHARGGDDLVIAVDRDAGTVHLRGPAVMSFEGEVTIDD